MDNLTPKPNEPQTLAEPLVTPDPIAPAPPVEPEAPVPEVITQPPEAPITEPEVPQAQPSTPDEVSDHVEPPAQEPPPPNEEPEPAASEAQPSTSDPVGGAVEPTPTPPPQPEPTLPIPDTPSGIPANVAALSNDELKIAAALYLKNNQAVIAQKGVEARRNTMNKNMDTIEQFIRSNGPSPLPRIAKHCNITPGTTSSYLRRLLAQNRIKAEGHASTRRYFI